MGQKINCILLIDDDESSNFINSLLLKKYDLSDSLEIASNGQEALDFIKKYSEERGGECPELILLDLNMPIMDGYEVMEHFNKLNFKNKDKVKIAILTNSINPVDKPKMEAAGVDHYINKPLSGEDLKRILGTVVA